MKRRHDSPVTQAKRGRPQKFGRPSQLMAITLPEDTIRQLQSLDADLGWAIVRLVDQSGAVDAAPHPAPLQKRLPIELIRVPGNLGLILISAAELKEIKGISMIPLSDGRAFIALGREGGIAELELAVLDRLETLPARSRMRANLLLMREQLREWRQDPTLRFRSRAIIVAEGVSAPSPGRLPRIEEAHSSNASPSAKPIAIRDSASRERK